jgi:hypothetical protein
LSLYWIIDQEQNHKDYSTQPEANMKNIWTLLPLILLFSCSSQPEVNFQKLGLDAALTQAQHSGKMILMDFWTDG